MLERLLSLFAEVRPGEGVIAIMLTFNLFLVLTSYYIAKVVREPLILTGGGAEMKSYLSAAMVVLLVFAVRFYALLAGKMSRRKLINSVNIFFAGCLFLFYVLAKAETPHIGVAFFIWVGMFAVMVVAQFWSFANDVYTPEIGKRLFPIVAFGASSGSVLGSYLPKELIPITGLHQLLLLAGVTLLVSLLITNFVDSRERASFVQSSRAKAAGDPPEKGVRAGAFKLVFRNKYLLMIAFLVLLLNWVNTTGEYILGRMVVETAGSMEAQSASFSAQDFIGKFYADFYTVVNSAGVLIQLFLVSRIFKYFGIRIAILILPVIALGGYLLLAVYPLLSIVRWAKTAENATDYSLNNTVRHALFLPTTKEEKYQAKQAVDSFFHRSGDVLSAMVVFVGSGLLSFDIKHFAVFNLVLVAVWLVLAIRIGAENRKLQDVNV